MMQKRPWVLGQLRFALMILKFLSTYLIAQYIVAAGVPRSEQEFLLRVMICMMVGILLLSPHIHLADQPDRLSTLAEERLLQDFLN